MIGINKALGMVDRPLQPSDEVAELRHQLAASKDTLASMQYSEAQHDLACEELGINLFPHEDGDTLIEAVCRLKEQLATVTRERDEAQRKYETQCQGSMSDKRRIAHLETTVRNYQSAANKIAVELSEVTSDRDALREQLATVQRVLVESLNLAEVGNEFAPPCVDVDNAMSLAAATEVAIDTLKLSAEKHKLDAEEANKALATVQAEAEAMRCAVEAALKLTVQYDRPRSNDGYQFSNYVTALCRDVLKSTAGSDCKRDAELCRELRAAIVGRGIGVDPSSNSVCICTTNFNRLCEVNDPANTSESEHRYYEQLYYDRLESDAKLCRELRALLPQSGYQMSMTIGSVSIECLEPQKLFDLLISIRDGGAT